MLRESVTLPFTSVVSYHTNPLTCGVAKFGKLLAERLGVPFVGWRESSGWGDLPLVSLKCSELSVSECLSFVARVDSPFGVFWHDSGNLPITESAEYVFYADPSLGYPGFWCPSLIEAKKRHVRLFSFGMAHKLQVEKYRRVRQLLDDAQQPFHLRVSVGLHEGTSLDGAEKHFDALKDIMGSENVTVLGILSDDAVSEELNASDYVLAFFEKGVRANNTTVHAALEHGCSVITTHDTQSPEILWHVTRDISTMTTWPDRKILQSYSWDRLIQQMAKICAASQSAPA